MSRPIIIFLSSIFLRSRNIFQQHRSTSNEINMKDRKFFALVFILCFLLLFIIVFSLVALDSVQQRDRLDELLHPELLLREHQHPEHIQSKPDFVTNQKGDLSSTSGVTQALHPYPWRVNETFLHFVPWNGMWNNVRQSFEIALFMACLLNRTLIIPEPDRGRRDSWQNAQLLRYEDAFDAELMRQNFKSIILSEFIRHGGVEYVSKRDGYPTEDGRTGKKELQHPDCGGFNGYECSTAANVIKRSFKRMLKTNDEYFVWGPPDYFPSDPSPKDPPYLKTHSRERSDFGSLMVPDTVVFIAGGLTTWYQYVYTHPSNDHGNSCKKKMVEALRYNKNLQAWADRIVSELGGRDKFSAIHMRRSDFKLMYSSFVHPPDTLLKKFERLFLPNETVLIATEVESEVREMQKERIGTINVKYFSDLTNFRDMLRAVPANQHPLVEQLVLGETRAFVGNHLSTFSMYSIRLRMFRGAVLPAAYTEAGVTEDGYPKPLAAWARFAWENGTDWMYPAPR